MSAGSSRGSRDGSTRWGSDIPELRISAAVLSSRMKNAGSPYSSTLNDVGGMSDPEGKICIHGQELASRTFTPADTEIPAAEPGPLDGQRDTRRSGGIRYAKNDPAERDLADGRITVVRHVPR